MWGIILCDGLSGMEESIMEKIGDLTDVIFVGASAGDDMKFKETFVYAGGKAYTNAALLLMIKPTVEFSFIKTQSFKKLDQTLTATKVDEAARVVQEFNGKPAVQAYAEALSIGSEEAGNRFMHNPVGLMLDDEPYVRSPQQISDGSIVFYCKVKEGMELSLLESGNIIDDTEKAIEEKVAELGRLSGIINFHCILRTLELEQKGQTRGIRTDFFEYSDLSVFRHTANNIWVTSTRLRRCWYSSKTTVVIEQAVFGIEGSFFFGEV